MDIKVCLDDTLGPVIHGCRNNFDFTLLFEQSFFQIVPSALLVLLLPLRIFQLRRQSVKTEQNWTKWFKLSAIVLLTSTQLTLIVLWTLTPITRTQASIPAAVVSFLASLALLLLSTLEHTRSVRPSSILNTYILLSLVLDLPQTRTLWLRSSSTILPAVFTTGLAAKAIVLYFEALSKKRYLLPLYRLYPPETLVNLYNRTVLWWLNSLFLRGYNGLLSFERLHKIDLDLASHVVEANLQQKWHAWSDRVGKRPLFWTLAVTLRGTLGALIVPRLCLSVFKLCQPLLIHRITSLLDSKPDNNSVNHGHGLIGATVLVYVGLAISNALYKRQLHRFLTKLRGSLIGAIHAKTLVSSSDKLSDNAVLTLITADISRICFSLQRIEDLFATPIEVAVAIYLLQRQIGVSCIAPVVLSAGITLISFYNSNKAVPMQKAWLAAVQERVSYISSVLSCPKGFKMLGLVPYLSSRIQNLRVKELADYAEYRKYVVYRNCFSHIPMAFGPAVTLTMFTLIQSGSALNPAVAFTTLALVALLTTPIQELIHAVPMFQTALASLDRIQTFLIDDNRDRSAFPREGNDGPTAGEFQEGAGGIVLGPIIRETDDGPIADEPILRLANAGVRIGKDDKLVLKDIDLAIAKGTLNVIVGPVGCGKSTLMKALLGDVDLVTGDRISSSPYSSYAYCAQEPWLPNGTFRNLVLAQSEMDTMWYATVVQACAMNSDIHSLADGDETMIGTKGVSLSGGQRQRLALARALYSRREVLFVDDTLSGLDASTSRIVFDRVFGRQGLCKRLGITVFLVTHAVQYLPEADHVIAVSEDGSIAKQGSFAELGPKGGYVHELSVKGTDPNRSHIEQEETQESMKAVREPDKIVVAQQDLARRTGDIAVYSYYAKSIGWRCGSVILLTAIAFGFFETFPTLWVRWWSEAEASERPIRPLGLWIGMYILFAVLSVIAVFTHIWVMLVNSVPRSSAQLHKQLLSAVMKAPYSFFVDTDAGVTLNRFSNDMNLIETELAGGVMMTLDGLCICIGAAALIAAGAKYAGAAIPFVIAVLYAIQKFYLRTSRQLRFMELESQAPLLAHCSETISGVTTIRAFGWQAKCHEKCLTLLDNSQRPYYLQLCIQRWLNLVLDLTTGAIALIVVSMALTLRSTASAGSVGLSMLQILSFNTQLAWLITSWTSLETALGAVARCRNLERTTESEDLPREVHAAADDWPKAGHLNITNVTASYKPESGDVLHHVSLSIAAGEKVGICGRTGSGKSSLLLTILRLLDYKSGSISLDNIDLATIPRQTIRERLTVIPQEVLTVPGSLKNNIDPLNSKSEREISNALQRVGLIDIVNERGGLEAKMSDLSLSQGQLQLFAVARAMLRKSCLVLIDEMTSNLDPVTEEAILSLIKQEFSESTVIAVAHRLKTIVNFDKIVVMDKGHLAEVGTPSELLARKDGMFRAMWELTCRYS